MGGDGGKNVLGALGVTSMPGMAALLGPYFIQKNAADVARKRQQLVLDREAQTENALTDQNLGITKQASQKYGGAARADAQAQAEQTAQTSLSDALAKATDGTLPSAGQGKVSDAYIADKATAAAGEMDRARKITQLMAKLRAPSDLRLREGIENAGAETAINANVGNMRSAQRAAQTDLSKIMPNQGAMLAGQMLGDFTTLAPRLAATKMFGVG